MTLYLILPPSLPSYLIPILCPSILTTRPIISLPNLICVPFHSLYPFPCLFFLLLRPVHSHFPSPLPTFSRSNSDPGSFTRIRFILIRSWILYENPVYINQSDPGSFTRIRFILINSDPGSFTRTRFILINQILDPLLESGLY